MPFVGSEPFAELKREILPLRRASALRLDKAGILLWLAAIRRSFLLMVGAGESTSADLSAVPFVVGSGAATALAEATG